MASSAILAELPTSDHITLLFKCHKSTVLLSVLPQTPWSNIKSLLLSALKSRTIDTIPGSTELLPEDPDQLELGILKDKKDVTRGWIPLELKGGEAVEGKSGKKKALGAQSLANDSPAGAGLSDGSLVAYRLRPNLSSMDEEDDLTNLPDDATWDVVLPIFEDEAEETED